jgi:hypothetical protein
MRALALATFLILALTAMPAGADDRDRDDWKGWGVRAGLGDDPDQFVFGVQFDFGEFHDDLSFEPSIELGLGDDHTILMFNGGVRYDFDVRDSVTPFLSGVGTLGFVDKDNGDDDFEIGLKAGGGARWPLQSGREVFVELLLGFGDLHDAQVMAGLKF